LARIGIDARLTYYTQGGISQYTQQIIRALGNIDAQNEYLLLHSRRDARDLAAASNQRRIICWTPSHHRIERLALAVELAGRRLDLLHSPDFIPPIGGRYKSVITIHDLAFLFYPKYLTAESRRFYNSQINAAVRRADHIIAVSEATRQDVIDHLGAPAEKISVVLEAADPRYQPAPPTEVERVSSALGLPPDYLLLVGTQEPRKNIDGLLRAYALLRERLPGAPLLVIAGGRGWLADDLTELAASLGLGAPVRWLGHIPTDDLPALYSGASVLGFPSFYEGFGLPPLEAMACGTPVVVSDRGSLPEVVGEAGLLVNPDDPAAIAAALEQVITDSALAADLRARGLERASTFSWERAARETLAVYERVLGAS
jgi:glycosyltransferase involved in cell wall biosynthesis